MLFWCRKGDILSHFDVKIIQLKLNWKEILMGKCVNASFFSLVIMLRGWVLGWRETKHVSKRNRYSQMVWMTQRFIVSLIFVLVIIQQAASSLVSQAYRTVYLSYFVCWTWLDYFHFFFLCILSINIFVFFPISLCIA